MTEKRFSLSKDTEWWFIQDNTIQVNKYGYRDDLTGEDEYRGLRQELTEQETVDLLNEVYEENKELKYKLRNCKAARKSYKQDWKACSSYCDEYKNKIISLTDEVEGLIEENKELKLQLKSFKDKLCELGVSNVKRYGKIYHTGLEEWLE